MIQLSTETDIPQGLKPRSTSAPYGAAKAAPLQNSTPVIFSFRWSWWTLAPLALAGAACAVPWMLTHSPELGLALQRGFALVCHQLEERSFVVFGGNVAVCARCLGIYLGAAVGLLVRVSRRVTWRCLIAAIAINVIDWAAEITGVHGNWMLARFALGIALGVAAGFLVAASFAEYTTPTQAKAA